VIRIIRADATEKLPAGSLMMGDTFMVSEDLATLSLVTDNDVFPFVNLATGEVYALSDNQEVTLMECELSARYKSKEDWE